MKVLGGVEEWKGDDMIKLYSINVGSCSDTNQNHFQGKENELSILPHHDGGKNGAERSALLHAQHHSLRLWMSRDLLL